ncbi:adenosine [Rhizoctonia solani]|uniref:Adenosine n=1 Tax=Rhizoctonia solani TaxID=456999 RepID=A0A8H7I6Y1_9AGAM|nr:adenosine [Rhizoctonia solani]
MHLSLSTIRSLGGLQLLVTLLCTRSVGAVPTSSNLLRRNGTLPSIYEYLQQRADLIAEERAIRFDAGFIKNATDKELRAMKIVDALRLREQQAIWFADPDKEPGMPFLWAKDTIAQTDLFKLIKKADAKRGAFTCPFGCRRGRTLFAQLALDYPSIHLRTASGVNSSAPFPTPIFRPLSQDEADQYVNNSFPTSPDYGLTRYEPIYRRYVDQLLVSQVEDGISYVEIRLGYSPTRTVISEDGTRNLTNSEYTKIIYSATRSISVPEMVQQLNDCLELKSKYPDLIAGFDMAGQEDPGHPLVFFAEALLDFRSKAEKRGLDIPFMFHAGETLDDGGEVDSNYTMRSCSGAKRIGHGKTPSFDAEI